MSSEQEQQQEQEGVADDSGSEQVSTFDHVESQPQDALERHNPNTPLASSASDPRAQSGDPLDPATKAAMDPDKPTPNAGERVSNGPAEDA